MKRKQGFIRFANADGDSAEFSPAELPLVRTGQGSSARDWPPPAAPATRKRCPDEETQETLVSAIFFLVGGVCGAMAAAIGFLLLG